MTRQGSRILVNRQDQKASNSSNLMAIIHFFSSTFAQSAFSTYSSVSNIEIFLLASSASALTRRHFSSNVPMATTSAFNLDTMVPKFLFNSSPMFGSPPNNDSASRSSLLPGHLSRCRPDNFLLRVSSRFKLIGLAADVHLVLGEWTTTRPQFGVGMF